MVHVKDPTFAYNEFVSVIKGSESSLKLQTRYLDRNSYEIQNNRTRSGDDGERSRVYTLFEAYSRLRPPSSYDLADRAHILLNALQVNGVPGKSLDFLYVQEIQDNLPVDVAPQTISAGSKFRFSELKSMLSSLERENINVRRGTRKPIDPNFFQLSFDFGSHSGIVNAAAFIISLIDSYFPHYIDPLAPEAIACVGHNAFLI
ncbi:hypothetical protein FRC00_001640 [Tulasnella sp. 408]|nr:hypothetical protein FRC00_001640 [Tulasnella sp. 408]